MSLDWDSEDCVPPVPQNDEERHIRKQLVFATMTVNLGYIDAKNVDEWVFRLWYQHKTIDHIMFDDDVTPEMVRGWVTRWVGLSTNAVTKSRKQWLNKVEELLSQQVEREVERSKTSAV